MNKDLYSLRHRNESILFTVSLVFSLLFRFLIVISIVWLFYGLIAFLFIIMWHALFMAYVKWNGTKVSPDQLPEIYSLVTSSCEKMWISTTPEIYILWSDGMLNAFATRTFSRNYVVIFSSLLESCEGNKERLQFIITHELTHIALKHVTYQFLLLPSHILPYVGNRYSRAREYTCDTVATYIVWSSEESRRGLAMLNVGGKYAWSVSLDAISKQVSDTTWFFGTIRQMRSTHPHLCRRIDYITKLFDDGDSLEHVSKQVQMVVPPSRNIFGVLLSPLFNIWIRVVFLYIGIFAIIALAPPQSMKGGNEGISFGNNSTSNNITCGKNSHPSPTTNECYCDDWYDREDVSDSDNMNCISSKDK